jgi:hypothetical protein
LFPRRTAPCRGVPFPAFSVFDVRAGVESLRVGGDERGQRADVVHPRCGMNIRSGSVRKEELRDIETLRENRLVKEGYAHGALGIGIGTPREKMLDHLDMAPAHGQTQRRRADPCDGIHSGTVRDEQLRDIRVSLRCGEVERRGPRRIVGELQARPRAGR